MVFNTVLKNKNPLTKTLFHSQKLLSSKRLLFAQASANDANYLLSGAFLNLVCIKFGKLNLTKESRGSGNALAEAP